MTPEEKLKTGQEIMAEIRAKTIEDLEKGEARQKAIRVLIEEIEAHETKFFQEKGVVTDQRDVIAHGPRLKAIELLIQIYGLKSPDKLTLDGDIRSSVIVALSSDDRDLLKNSVASITGAMIENANK